MSNLIEKISLLLNKAENASTPEEAEAYFAKAQELATRESIDLAQARAHARKGTQVPVLDVRSFRLGDPRTKGLHTYVTLFSAIAHANDVRIDVAGNSTYVYAYGFDTDIEVVETLFTSLLQQMIQASAKYLASGDYKQDKVYRQGRYNSDGYWKPSGFYPVHGSTARISFQESFAVRVGERLRKARAQTIQTIQAEQHAAPGTGAELVLASKAVAVRDFHSRSSDAKGTYKGGQTTARSHGAARAGREAGDRARISPAAIGGSRRAVSA